MQAIKGFVTINEFINNTPGNLSTIGELSPQSLTYSREKGFYQDSLLPGLSLITFNVVNTATNAKERLNSLQVTEILTVVKDIKLFADANIRPLSRINLVNSLLVKYTGGISSIEVGPFVDNGSIAIPEWVSWISVANNSRVKIWLADAAFASQYDIYEITVVPPIIPLDSMFNLYSTVVESLASNSITSFAETINIARADNPDSYFRILSFKLVNALDPNQTFDTNWGVLIYGAAGDNTDAIKEAITTYVLTNSSKTETQWIKIIPELFIRTEFVIIPRWDKIAIPNMTSNSVLYRSMINANDAITFAQEVINFYPAPYIAANTIIMPYDYKNISLVVVNGNNNIITKNELTKIFPDYLAVNTSSPDFYRMKLGTQNWSLILQRLLIYAETADENTTIPTTFRRINRGGIFFISVEYNSINYLVAAKTNSIFNT